MFRFPMQVEYIAICVYILDTYDTIAEDKVKYFVCNHCII